MSIEEPVSPLTNTNIFGFDSAWADRNPGAICMLSFGDCGEVGFNPPQLVRFSEALGCIKQPSASAERTVVAMDQPTIASNATGMRPAERVAESVLSYTGGGVQPQTKAKRPCSATVRPPGNSKRG